LLLIFCFCDPIGDGNFSITLTDRKKKGKTTTKRVQTFFLNFFLFFYNDNLSIYVIIKLFIKKKRKKLIEIRQTYHRDASVEQGGTSYFAILSKVATYLGVNLLSRTREQKDKVFYAFMVISHSAASHAKAISYFDRFPLYSSKYLAYKD
jgi:hypothetical protein